MNSSDADVRHVARIVAREGDEESISRFLTAGSIRYDREQLEGMLGDSQMPLMEAMIESSWLFREAHEKGTKAGLEEGRKEGLEEGLEQGIEQGLEQGIEQGREVGRITEARRALRIVLKSKFPGLDEMPEIDRVSTA